MNKWLKIGGIAAAVGVGLAAVAVAGLIWLRPVTAQAQMQTGWMERAGEMGSPPAQFGPRGGQFGPMGGRGPGWGIEGVDHQALLAEALGITVEELQAAYQQAHTAAVEQALDEGLISQVQADSMLARLQLADYLDREALLAEALGLSVEELQAALDEGKSLPVLANEQGLDPFALQAAMHTAHRNALEQAVEDGVITQEQADQLLQNQGVGLGRGGGFGHHGQGRFGGGPGGPGGGFDQFGGGRGPGGFGGRGW